MDGDFKGDFTRDTFGLMKHFSRVLMQQGRVQLDADWNEQADIFLHFLRSFAKHVIGDHGGSGDGFFINDDNQLKSGNFTIKRGCYYVDGILVENEGLNENGEQKDYTYTAQHFYSANNFGDRDLPLLVYLDVWERQITSLEDESIREVALGSDGPDTTTRTEVVWQVKLMKEGEVGNIKYQNQDITFEAFVKSLSGQNVNVKEVKQAVTTYLQNLSLLDTPGKGKLAIVSGQDNASTPPAPYYQSDENRLYRVEIHKGGPARNAASRQEVSAENATFKWSRENGSVVLPLAGGSKDTDTLELVHMWREERLGLHPGDYVELLDDDSIKRPDPAHLYCIESIDPPNRQVTLNPPIIQGSIDFDEHPFLRRWDQKPPAKGTGMDLTDEGTLPVVEGPEILLEDGIRIKFQSQGGTYHQGDYWLIPARAATGNVEWPLDSQTKLPKAMPPRGIQHHYAPLAIIYKNGGQTVAFDLRYTFKPLIELSS